MDIDLMKTLAKYPFIFEEKFYDSNELKQNKTCLKCKEKDCFQLLSKDFGSDFICSKNYDCRLMIIGGLKFITNGLIYSSNTKIPKGTRDIKSDWIVEEQEINMFQNKIEEIENFLVKRINETMEKNFSMFHDFKTSMTIFYGCTQDIINSFPGDSFIEKLNGSGKAYQNLYNALDLITSQLRMIDVIVNPKSIEFGRKRSTNIYKLFEKMIILFEHLKGKKDGVSISLTSQHYINESNCFESIQFIPLILIDNALKYSVSNSKVEIKLEQGQNSVKVIVKNIGPLVSDENETKIFEKFFRDESGQSFSKEGMGMGLWIAQQILTAHGSVLKYAKDSKETREIGLNVFEFDLPTG